MRSTTDAAIRRAFGTSRPRPGIRFSPASAPRGLVLLAPGGGQDHTSPGVVARSTRLTRVANLARTPRRTSLTETLSVGLGLTQR